MKNKVYRTVQEDEALDTMIKLAFLCDDELFVQSVQEEFSAPATVEEVARAQRIHAAACRKLAAQQRILQRQRRLDRLNHIAPRVIQVAACVVLIFGLAVPVSVATVETMREKLQHLSIQFDSQADAVDIRTIANKPADIPANWGGDYFFTFLPGDFVLQSCQNFFGNHRVKYTDSSGRLTTFTECSIANEALIGFENSEEDEVYINGWHVFVVKVLQEHYVKCIWSIGSSWFILDSFALTDSELFGLISNISLITKPAVASAV